MPKRKLIPGTTAELLDRDGLSAKSVAVWEDGMRADTGPGSFEWWYFDAHFEDGSTVVIVFATKPILQRNDPLTPGVRLVITTSDGRQLGGYPIFSPAQFSAAREQCDVHIAHNSVCGDLHRYEVHVEYQGVSADLVFKGIVPPWRPGAGKTYYDEELKSYFAWLPPIPHGTVEGTLVYEGKQHKVKGTGYHDHNWGNIGLETVMSHWYWGRAHVGEYTTIFVEMNSAAAYGRQKLPVFMLAKGSHILIGDGAPLLMQARELERHPGGRDIPNKVDFYWENHEGKVHIGLRQPQVIEASSLLGLLPPWKQRIARLFANPYYFRFNAEMKLKVELDGKKDSAAGQALFEIMMLR